MSEETCPERVRLVEKLARAINKEKHADRSQTTPEERQKAEEEVGEALEAVREDKASGGCKSAPSKGRKAS